MHNKALKQRRAKSARGLARRSKERNSEIMKNVVISAISVLMLSCTIGANEKQSIEIHKNNAKGIDSIITNQALESFNTDYKSASENKAFAQSTSGAWNWKSNRTSVEHAKTSALIGCQRNNKKSEYLYPCKVIHANGEWIE